MRCSRIFVFDCLDAKHWDLSVWTFTRCIAYLCLCAKLSPICIPGTYLLETLLYFAPDSHKVVYMEPQSPLSPLTGLSPPAIAATAAAAATPPPRHHRRPPRRRPRFSPLAWSLLPTAIATTTVLLLFVDCCLPCHLCHLCCHCRLCFQNRHCCPPSEGRRQS